MAFYTYSGRNQRGSIVKGVLEAKTEDIAAAELLESGVTPIDIHLNRRADDLSGWVPILFGQGLKTEDLILVCRQLYSLNKAGIPMLQALNTLLKTLKKPILIDAFKKMISGLESGLSLSQAMCQSPKVFSPVMINMVNVGENTGRLDEVFKQMASYLELEKETIKSLKQITRYPVIVTTFIALAILVVNYYVVPSFVSVFDRLGAALPLPTKILMGSSYLFVNYWWALLGGVIALTAFCWNYVNTDEGRLQWDYTKLRLPIIGEILERVALTRLFRVLAMMLKEGVPVLRALTIVSGAVGNEHIKQKILSMVGSISSGESFTNAASKCELFSPIVIQMIAVGEVSGSLDQLLEEVAQFYESEVEYDLKRFSDWIEPVLVILLATMALVLALGVFLPLWDLGAVATQMR